MEMEKKLHYLFVYHFARLLNKKIPNTISLSDTTMGSGQHYYINVCRFLQYSVLTQFNR